MKTFFVLGRNPLLSRLEVLSFLSSRKRDYSEVLFEDNLLVLEVPDGEKFNIQEFGGVVKLGYVSFDGLGEDFRSFLSKEDVVPSDKFSYVVFGNGDVELLKSKFKSERRKASLKHGRNRMKMQDGSFSVVSHADFSFFYYENDNKVLFGVVSQEYDYDPVKFRDMHKPVRREHLAISPRLAKVLVNLSGAKPGLLLLDPFCGVGGILQESLVKGIKCYGSDRDKKAILSAEKNLSWLSQEFDVSVKYQLECLDSRKVPDLQFGAIATETPLGVVLKKKPTDSQAKKIIADFESLIIPILIRLRKVKKLGAKIAITFPVIRKFHVDAGKVCEKTKLEVFQGPIVESREDQFISRDIFIFV